MKSVAITLAFLATASALWAVVASLAMGAWLSRHGVKVNGIIFKALSPWYVRRYRTMTQELEGRTGTLFPQFVVPISLAILFGVAAVIALTADRG